ncbi:RNA-directed DNA polymerase from mobile element jockey, partial [Araneus ventricosus]
DSIHCEKRKSISYDCLILSKWEIVDLFRYAGINTEEGNWQKMHERKSLSPSHQLRHVIELIHDGFAKSKTTSALFLDVAKAFDKIWHNGLLAKFIRLSCSAQLIKIIHLFLTSPSFRVPVNNILPSPIPILSDCAQGYLFLPALFKVYVNDIPKTPSCEFAIFADDITILTKHKHSDIAIKTLKNYVSQLQLWLTKWKIKVDLSKCECLLFTKK